MLNLRATLGSVALNGVGSGGEAKIVDVDTQFVVLAWILGFCTPTSSKFVAVDGFEGWATRALLLLLFFGVLVPLDVLDA